MAEGFCTTCGFVVESFDGLEKCPQCGSEGVPCCYENQIDVNVNIHELRLLCIWAENWGHKCGNPDVIYGVASRFRKQLPPGKDMSLTMADEFKEIKDAGYKFETNHLAADNPETGDSFTPDL